MMLSIDLTASADSKGWCGVPASSASLSSHSPHVDDSLQDQEWLQHQDVPSATARRPGALFLTGAELLSATAAPTTVLPNTTAKNEYKKGCADDDNNNDTNADTCCTDNVQPTTKRPPPPPPLPMGCLRLDTLDRTGGDRSDAQRGHQRHGLPRVPAYFDASETARAAAADVTAADVTAAAAERAPGGAGMVSVAGGGAASNRPITAVLKAASRLVLDGGRAKKGSAVPAANQLAPAAASDPAAAGGVLHGTPVPSFNRVAGKNAGAVNKVFAAVSRKMTPLSVISAAAERDDDTAESSSDDDADVDDGNDDGDEDHRGTPTVAAVKEAWWKVYTTQQTRQPQHQPRSQLQPPSPPPPPPAAAAATRSTKMTTDRSPQPQQPQRPRHHPHGHVHHHQQRRTTALPSHGELDAALSDLATRMDALRCKLRAADNRYADIPARLHLTLPMTRRGQHDDDTSILGANTAKHDWCAAAFAGFFQPPPTTTTPPLPQTTTMNNHTATSPTPTRRDRAYVSELHRNRVRRGVLNHVGIITGDIAPGLTAVIDRMVERVEARSAAGVVRVAENANSPAAAKKKGRPRGSTKTKTSKSVPKKRGGPAVAAIGGRLGVFGKPRGRPSRAAAACAADSMKHEAKTAGGPDEDEDDQDVEDDAAAADDDEDDDGEEHKEEDEDDVPIKGSFRFNAQSKRTQPLRDWLVTHFDHPYPEDEDKLALAAASGMTRAQVGNWFINARVRIWRPMVLSLGEELEQRKGGEGGGGEGGGKGGGGGRGRMK